MQTFKVYQAGDQLILTNGDEANLLRLHSLQDLLRLRQRINRYLDDQQADGQMDANSPLLVQEWLDTGEARQLAQALGHGDISLGTIKSACLRGNIAGARKHSRSGRAQTERGGRWEFPRWAFIEWLAQRATPDRRGRRITEKQTENR
jgi:hypothetical protein